MKIIIPLAIPNAGLEVATRQAMRVDDELVLNGFGAFAHTEGAAKLASHNGALLLVTNHVNQSKALQLVGQVGFVPQWQISRAA